jgi:hypothetical protein
VVPHSLGFDDTASFTVMPSSLTIRLKKGHDGNVASFALHRADGSVTVQRNGNPFFPIHDLTHLAVESVLGHQRGFYGLVSEGWSFTDFGTPWPRGPLPEDADPSELIVGYLDLERATGERWTVDDLNGRVRDIYAQRMHRAPPPDVTQEQLDAIHVTMRSLIDRWRATAPGETLQLPFPLDASVSEGS